jgi:hypothetical protein
MADFGTRYRLFHVMLPLWITRANNYTVPARQQLISGNFFYSVAETEESSMLAQAFRTAADLGITEFEHDALISVLGMLERGELVDVGYLDACDNGFNMGVSGEGCGTPACIGGWMAYLMGVNQQEYTERYSYSHRSRNPMLHELFWNEEATERPAKAAQAAIAVRSYLTIGNPHWDLALSPCPT